MVKGKKGNKGAASNSRAIGPMQVSSPPAQQETVDRPVQGGGASQPSEGGGSSILFGSFADDPVIRDDHPKQKFEQEQPHVSADPRGQQRAKEHEKADSFSQPPLVSTKPRGQPIEGVTIGPLRPVQFQGDGEAMEVYELTFDKETAVESTPDQSGSEDEECQDESASSESEEVDPSKASDSGDEREEFRKVDEELKEMAKSQDERKIKEMVGDRIDEKLLRKKPRLQVVLQRQAEESRRQYVASQKGDPNEFPLLKEIIEKGGQIKMTDFMEDAWNIISIKKIQGLEFKKLKAGYQNYLIEVEVEKRRYLIEAVDAIPALDKKLLYPGNLASIRRLNADLNVLRYRNEQEQGANWLAVASMLEENAYRESGKHRLRMGLSALEAANLEQVKVAQADDLWQFFFGKMTAGAAASVAHKHGIPSGMCSSRDSYAEGQMHPNQYDQYESDVISWMGLIGLKPPSPVPGKFRRAVDSSPPRDTEVPSPPRRSSASQGPPQGPSMGGGHFYHSPPRGTSSFGGNTGGAGVHQKPPYNHFNERQDTASPWPRSKPTESSPSDRSMLSMSSMSSQNLKLTMASTLAVALAQGGLKIETLRRTSLDDLKAVLNWLQGIIDFGQNCLCLPLIHLICSQQALDAIKKELPAGVSISTANIDDIIRAVGKIMGSLTHIEFYQRLRQASKLVAPLPASKEDHEGYLEILAHHVKTRVSLAMTILGAFNPDLVIRMWVPENMDSVAQAIQLGCGPYLARYIRALSDADPEGLRRTHDLKRGGARSLPSEWTDPSHWRWDDRSHWIDLLVDNIQLFGVDSCRKVIMAGAPVWQNETYPPNPPTTTHAMSAAAFPHAPSQELMAFASKPGRSGYGGLDVPKPNPEDPRLQHNRQVKFSGQQSPSTDQVSAGSLRFPARFSTLGQGTITRSWKDMPCWPETELEGSCTRGENCRFSHDKKLLDRHRKERQAAARRNKINSLSPLDQSRLAVMLPSEVDDFLDTYLEPAEATMEDAYEDDNDMPMLMSDSDSDEDVEMSNY